MIETAFGRIRGVSYSKVTMLRNFTSGFIMWCDNIGCVMNLPRMEVFVGAPRAAQDPMIYGT